MLATKLLAFWLLKFAEDSLCTCLAPGSPFYHSHHPGIQEKMHCWTAKRWNAEVGQTDFKDGVRAKEQQKQAVERESWGRAGTKRRISGGPVKKEKVWEEGRKSWLWLSIMHTLLQNLVKSKSFGEVLPTLCQQVAMKHRVTRPSLVIGSHTRHQPATAISHCLRAWSAMGILTQFHFCWELCRVSTRGCLLLSNLLSKRPLRNRVAKVMAKKMLRLQS